MRPVPFDELVRGARLRPGMYVSSSRVDCFLAFIDGYAWALDDGSLEGFSEWLSVRHGEPASNIRWAQLLVIVAHGGNARGAPNLDHLDSLTVKRHLELIDRCGELILSFLDEKSGRGVEAIRGDYRALLDGLADEDGVPAE